MPFFSSNDPEQKENGANKTLFGIICVTVLFFLLASDQKSPLTMALCLSSYALNDWQLWRLFSSLLIQLNGWNLFFEMFALYIFGTIISHRLGAAKMLSLYLFSGLAGNLLWLAFNWNSPIAIFGCSGAVNGVIMASAMAVPDMQMYLLFIPFPVKLRTMAIVFIVLNVLLSGLSPFALLDVGGFIGGYLFMRLFLRSAVSWDILDSLLSGKKQQHVHTVYAFKKPAARQPQGSRFPRKEEVDRILDKLSRTGINSLTDEEIRVLETVREQMNRKQ